MGHSQRVVITDDLTGEGTPEKDAQAIRFTYAGAEYDLDLSTDSAAKRDEAVQPFVNSTRRVGGRAAAKPESPAGRPLGPVCTWAAKNVY